MPPLAVVEIIFVSTHDVSQRVAAPLECTPSTFGRQTKRMGLGGGCGSAGTGRTWLQEGHRTGYQEPACSHSQILSVIECLNKAAPDDLLDTRIDVDADIKMQHAYRRKHTENTGHQV